MKWSDRQTFWGIALQERLYAAMKPEIAG